MKLTTAIMQTTPLCVMDTRNAPQTTSVKTNLHSLYWPGQYTGHDVTNTNAYPGVKKLAITGGHDTVYLKYFDNEITSVELPQAGPDVFLTDNLSGCAIVVAHKPNGNIVVFHANTQEGSDEKTMSKKKPSYQTDKAKRIIKKLRRDAGDGYFNLTVLYTLLKSEYLSAVDALAARGSDFLGGTTVAGFRGAGGWEFWYQNFGSISGAANAILHSEQFYP